MAGSVNSWATCRRTTSRCTGEKVKRGVRVGSPNLVITARLAIFLIVFFVYGCVTPQSSSTDSNLHRPPTDPPSLYQRALSSYRAGAFQQARELLDALLPQTQPTAELYNLSGLIHQHLGQHTRAIADFERALKLDPRYAQSYSNRAVSREALGDLALAKADFDMALKVDPKHVTAYYNLAIVHYLEGDYAAAVKHLEQATQLAPDDSDSWFQLGLAYDRLGDLDRTILAFSRVIEIEQGFDDEAFLWRGLAYLEKGQFTSAEADFSNAIAKGLRTRDTLFYRGLARYYLQRDAEALVDFDDALAYAPKDAESYYYKSYIYARRGDQDKARAAAQKALELDPPADASTP